MGAAKAAVASQEAFDAAVQENIVGVHHARQLQPFQRPKPVFPSPIQEEFDMGREEAAKSALEEFKLQGMDTSGISLQGAGALEEARAAMASAVRAVDQAVHASTPDPTAICMAVREAEAKLLAAEPTELAAVLTAAVDAGLVPLLPQAAAACQAQPDGEEASLSLLHALMRGGLADKEALEQARQAVKQAFFTADGAVQLALLIQGRSGPLAVVQAVAAGMAAACARHEGNKCAAVDSGCCGLLVQALRPGAASEQAPAVQAVCALLRSVTTADDPRPPASRCFLNARLLAKAGAGLKLLQLLDGGRHSSPDLLADLCSALKKLAANEDICKELAEAGAAADAMQVLRSHHRQAKTAQAACSLLRQLAGSDAIRADLAAQGALELLASAAETHMSSPGTIEQVLGLLAALTLRSPGVAEQAIAVGCGDAALQALGESLQGRPTPAWQWAARQACMALRNIVSRSPELRATLLQREAEPLLRRSMQTYPQACGDVGSAALRDLGLDDYLPVPATLPAA